ncbi:MAG: hypothetical protein R3E94_03900 [Burkholderiaceae bacterium]
MITNTQGAVTERLAYDAWGKRRHVDGQRGYTMYEHMDQIGVINMNGRVYDPPDRSLPQRRPAHPAPR